MNHKRGRPKNRRAGCRICKPWKGNGCYVPPPRERRKLQDRPEDRRGEAA